MSPHVILQLSSTPAASRCKPAVSTQSINSGSSHLSWAKPGNDGTQRKQLSPENLVLEMCELNPTLSPRQTGFCRLLKASSKANHQHAWSRRGQSIWICSVTPECRCSGPGPKASVSPGTPNNWHLTPKFPQPNWDGPRVSMEIKGTRTRFQF